MIGYAGRPKLCRYICIHTAYMRSSDLMLGIILLTHYRLGFDGVPERLHVLLVVRVRNIRT